MSQTVRSWRKEGADVSSKVVNHFTTPGLRVGLRSAVAEPRAKVVIEGVTNPVVKALASSTESRTSARGAPRAE